MEDVLGLPSFDSKIEFANAGLAAVGVFDDTDNILSPTRGYKGDLIVMRYPTSFGGDYDCWQVDTELDSA